jgi:hypothetical protein
MKLTFSYWIVAQLQPSVEDIHTLNHVLELRRQYMSCWADTKTPDKQKELVPFESTCLLEMQIVVNCR